MKRVFTIPRRTHGSGPLLFTWQSVTGNYLVTTGLDQLVNIYDRHGEKQLELSLPGICTGISWDKDGTILSCICEHSNALILWDSNTRTVSHVDSGLRDPLTLVVWSKSAPILAVGTIKGNLLIYMYRTSKKISILGKHNKQIISGAWSQQNYLALVASDKSFTLSNADGDTLHRANLKGDPSLVQFSSMKQDGPGGGETTVSLILNKKSLFLLNIHDPEDPIILSFQENYGTVIDYSWHGEGYILIGFSFGFFIVLSTLLKEIGQEMSHVQCFSMNLLHMAVCPLDNKVIGCGDDNKIKTYDIRNLQDTLQMITVDDEQAIDSLCWSDDGQLLALSGREGNLHVYLTKLPVLGSAYNQKFAYLSSLYEVSIFSATNKTDLKKLKIDIEPKFIALGPFHLAIGMNNRAWFYNISDGSGTELLYDREYLSTVRSLYLNSDYASALIEGKIQLHTIDEPNSTCLERESRIFPDADQKNTIITCHALTNDFLIFGTDTGLIQLFSLMEFEFSVSINHPLNTAIKLLCSDFPGTRYFVMDTKGSAYIYNPVDSNMLLIPNFRSNTKEILFDHWPLYKGIFIAFDDENANSYIYVHDSLEGSKVEEIHTFPRNELYPGLLVSGELIFLTPSGKTSSMSVPGHRVDIYNSGHDDTILMNNFQIAVKLKRFDQAFMLASIVKSDKIWHELAKAALYNLDIGTASRVYQKLGIASKVLKLEEIKEVEDTKLLSGYVAEYFFKDYELAQNLYLTSSKPSAALEMRKHLFHWDAALKLAITLSPQEVPIISKEYAEQLEFTGDYSNAVHHYEKGLLDDISSNDILLHNNACKAGIARTSIRCGDYKRGIALAEEINNPLVYQECASILEEMKVISDAAVLYEKGGLFDNAATLYIKLKNWKKVKEFLPSISSPKVHAQYAKAQEADGKYAEAAVAYENASEYTNAIRIYLDYLKDPDSAVRLVKLSNSLEGARMVARFFQNYNDSPSAIKFLVLSNCKNEAFVLAQDSSNMSTYADAIGENGEPDDYINIAAYYEEKQNYLLAGKYFIYAQRYKKAVKLLLDVSGSDEDEAIKLAIIAAGKANDDLITRQIINHIMGEADGAVKDLQHLYNLYITLGQIKEAARTAVIMASAEQNSGTYRKARLLLLSMYSKLKERNMKIPVEISNSLMLLHSYSLAKLHMQRGDHLKSARMLVRVSNNISRFPRHDVQILTTTVLQCLKAGLPVSAHKAAVMLMRPEYRPKIDPKYKRKIENVVRKSPKLEEEEPNEPCPYCDIDVPQTVLYCKNCRYNLPYCIVTGYHIIRGDIALCPKCHFPAIHAEFTKSLSVDQNCPMCLIEIQLDELQIIEHIAPENFDEDELIINPPENKINSQLT